MVFKYSMNILFQFNFLFNLGVLFLFRLFCRIFKLYLYSHLSSFSSFSNLSPILL